MSKISLCHGMGSMYHNKREYEKYGRDMPNNIDKNKIKDNIILVEKNLKKTYDEIFSEALINYNNRQKRSDRKIKNYLDHVKNSKNGEKIFHEIIVQYGNMNDYKNNPDLKNISKNLLIDYVNSFEKRNPNLKIIGAYIHMDEASPHLHLDYIPVAYNYKKGLNVRNSLSKAMEQMGFKTLSKNQNATKSWQQNEKKYITNLFEKKGLAVEKEEHYSRKQLSVLEYKKAIDILKKDIEPKKNMLNMLVEKNNDLANTINGKIDKLNLVSKELQIKEKELNSLSLQDIEKDVIIKNKSILSDEKIAIMPLNDYKKLIGYNNHYNELQRLNKAHTELIQGFSKTTSYKARQKLQKQIDELQKKLEDRDNKIIEKDSIISNLEYQNNYVNDLLNLIEQQDLEIKAYKEVLGVVENDTRDIIDYDDFER